MLCEGRSPIIFLVNEYVYVVYTMFEILYIFGACISGYIGFAWYVRLMRDCFNNKGVVMNKLR